MYKVTLFFQKVSNFIETYNFYSCFLDVLFALFYSNQNLLNWSKFYCRENYTYLIYNL